MLLQGKGGGGQGCENFGLELAMGGEVVEDSELQTRKDPGHYLGGDASSTSQFPEESNHMLPAPS